MGIKVAEWTDYLGIDGATIDALREVRLLVEPEIEEVLDRLYRRILANPAGAAVFRSPSAALRARAAQKHHWIQHVLSGRFDDDYAGSAKAIGRAHHGAGVDLMLYVGAYSLVIADLSAIVMRARVGDPDRLEVLLRALGLAVFLDMGLAVSVYYDSVLQAFEELSLQLNMSLARAGEYRDNETGGHIMRMSRMCAALAKAIGKDADWCRMMLLASPLHDVGKIGIVDAILLKPGSLTDEEVRRMQLHPLIGGNIIPDNEAKVIQMAKRIALTHHERWDGSGYPVGLSGGEIPLEGRIAAICDVYDALVSERPYKRAWPKEAALRHISENSGRHFDPELVRAFLGIETEIDDIQQHFADRRAG